MLNGTTDSHRSSALKRVWTANNEVNISDFLFAVIKFAYPNPAVSCKPLFSQNDLSSPFVSKISAFQFRSAVIIERVPLVNGERK